MEIKGIDTLYYVMPVENINRIKNNKKNNKKNNTKKSSTDHKSDDDTPFETYLCTNINKNSDY